MNRYHLFVNRILIVIIPAGKKPFYPVVMDAADAVFFHVIGTKEHADAVRVGHKQRLYLFHVGGFQIFIGIND